MASHIIKERSSDPTLCCTRIIASQTLNLRHTVLWPSKPISEVALPEDEDGIHLGAFLSGDDKQPIAVISLFIQPLPEPIPNDIITIVNQHPPKQQVRVRQFACDPGFRGRGIGLRLFEFALERAKADFGASFLWLDARTPNIIWYGKRGLKPCGERFFVGPYGHVRMYAEIGGSVEEIVETLHEA